MHKSKIRQEFQSARVQIKSLDIKDMARLDPYFYDNDDSMPPATTRISLSRIRMSVTRISVKELTQQGVDPSIPSSVLFTRATLRQGRASQQFSTAIPSNQVCWLFLSLGSLAPTMCMTPSHTI